MRQVNIQEAKTNLSKLLADVEAGDEVVIARSGKPVAKLVALASTIRVLGLDQGRITIVEDFDAPLPEELLTAFESG